MTQNEVKKWCIRTQTHVDYCHHWNCYQLEKKMANQSEDTSYPTPEQFLSELERDLLKERDPMKRHQITLGYARLMSLREESIKQGAVLALN